MRGGVLSRIRVKRRLRIAMLLPELGPGGAERVAATLANRWVAEGREVTVICFERLDKRPFYVLNDAVVLVCGDLLKETARVAEKFVYTLRRILFIRRAVAASDCDVVVSFLTEMNVLALAAGVHRTARLIIAEHSDPVSNSLAMPWGALRQVTYRRAARVLALTEDAARHIRRYAPHNVDVIPNPVAIELARPLGDYHRDGRTVAAMGRFVPTKRMSDVVRSFLAIAGRHPCWRLVIIGDGPGKIEVEALAAESFVGSRIQFAGTTRSPHEVLARADVFVSASALEGFPMGILEAMALGLPVVAARYGDAAAEIVRDGENGYLVDVGDVDALGDRTVRLLESASLRARMGCRSREIAAAYSLDCVAARWSALFGDDDPTMAKCT